LKLHGLRAQVLLWTVLPLTILLIIFAFSGVNSHQNSMQSLAIEENSRLITALARLLVAETKLYVVEQRLTLAAVQAHKLDLNRLLAVEHPHTIGTVALLDEQGRVLFSRGTPPPDHPLQAWLGVEAPIADGSVEFIGEHGDVVAYTPIADLGWILVIRESWHALTDPLFQIEQILPLILFTATAVSLLTLFFGLHLVVRPLQELGIRANLIGQGQFQATAESVGGVQEIEDLRETLHRMAQQVQNYQTALHDYLRAVTQTQEEERARLGRELHDETVQTLIALSHKAQVIQRHYERAAPQTSADIQTMRQMITSAIDEVRRFSRALHPHYLEELGLVTALETLAQEGGATFYTTGSGAALLPEQELAIYRVAQEAFNNARHHAAAQHIEIRLQFAASEVQLCVKDDGKGFTVPVSLNDLTRSGHFGLIGMRERARLVNGHLTINSVQGSGTLVTLKLRLTP
jgi:signal transduction histidine kinase